MRRLETRPDTGIRTQYCTIRIKVNDRNTNVATLPLSIMMGGKSKETSFDCRRPRGIHTADMKILLTLLVLTSILTLDTVASHRARDRSLKFKASNATKKAEQRRGKG